MGKRRQAKRHPAHHPSPSRTPDQPREDRSVLAVTILWMLTVLSSVAAEAGVIACLIAVRLWPGIGGAPDLRRGMAGALLLAALITGVLCLLLTPLVWRLRAIKPPRTVMIAAVLAGATPIATLLVLQLLA